MFNSFLNSESSRRTWADGSSFRASRREPPQARNTAPKGTASAKFCTVFFPCFCQLFIISYHFNCKLHGVQLRNLGVRASPHGSMAGRSPCETPGAWSLFSSLSVARGHRATCASVAIQRKKKTSLWPSQERLHILHIILNKFQPPFNAL